MHFDVVEVSGANQYSVQARGIGHHLLAADGLDGQGGAARRLEAAADAAGLLPAAAGVLPEAAELLLELAHADTVSARAASAAAPHIFRISDSPLRSANDLPLEITCGRACSVQLVSGGGSPSWLRMTRTASATGSLAASSRDRAGTATGLSRHGRRR